MNGKNYIRCMGLLKNILIILSFIVSTIATNAQNIPSYVPKNGLVGYWPFNGNANDESGNGMHGTGTPNFIADRDSVTNSAISLPSISAIQLPSSVFQYEYGDTFSFSFWFTHEASGNARIFSTENSEGNFRIANGNANGAYDNSVWRRILIRYSFFSYGLEPYRLCLQEPQCKLICKWES